MKRDGTTLGWGMAACSWLAARFDCTASIELRDDGTVRVASASQDIGTGTYTVMAQMVAETLGIAIERVEVVIGDSSLPPGAISGGSMLTASLIAPIDAAIAAAGKALIALGRRRPRHAISRRQGKRASFPSRPDRGEKRQSAGDDIRRSVTGVEDQDSVWVKARAKAHSALQGKPKFSSHSFGAHFVEVTWQPDIARLRVSRVVSVFDAGRIINPLAARNQIEGAVVMGIGMALVRGHRI